MCPSSVRAATSSPCVPATPATSCCRAAWHTKPRARTSSSSSCEARSKQQYLEARRRASQLENVSLTFHANAGDEGKLFGSITSADIAERLKEQNLDFDVDKRDIELEEPIKALGVYNVAVRLHTDVKPEIKVWVIKQD